MCVPDWAPPEVLADTFELLSGHSLSEFKDKEGVHVCFY